MLLILSNKNINSSKNSEECFAENEQYFNQENLERNGGNQSWWKNTKDFVSKTGKTGEYLADRGCGAVAESRI